MFIIQQVNITLLTPFIGWVQNTENDLKGKLTSSKIKILIGHEAR